MNTIAAISSAIGPGARIIVRLSGAEAIRIAAAFCDRLPEAGEAERTWLRFGGLEFPAWVYLFRMPRSYTGEDLVEFHIPGNTVLAHLLLGELLATGARLAEPGEFTARAYFSGRIDLTAAEGVAASIAASNEQELAAGRRLMAGELAGRLAPITDLITQSLALIEVGIDFSDEDVSFLSASQARQQINRAATALDQLLVDSVRFERLVHEPLVVLVGRPNAGKSTLLNALAGQQRAVVSSVAGTTRDALSVELPLRRGVVRLVDVAGIDHSEHKEPSPGNESGEQHIQRRMREQAIRTVERADVVLLVLEHGDPRPRLTLNRQPDWIVRSKMDLCSTSPNALANQTSVCAVSSRGLDELKSVIDRLAFGEAPAGHTLAMNTRHVRAIEEARTALVRAHDQAEHGAELLALELREALDVLGTVSGIITPDDVLSRVFSAFCIGK